MALGKFVQHIKKGEGMSRDSNQLLYVIIAILLPPLAVFLKKGFGSDLIINIILTLLFFVPGLIHALWVVLK